MYELMFIFAVIIPQKKSSYTMVMSQQLKCQLLQAKKLHYLQFRIVYNFFVTL